MFVWAGGRRDRILFRNPSGLVLRADDKEPLWEDVTEVWYADCCPTDLTDPAMGRPFRVFDHHISNAQKFGDDPRCTFDMTMSGTSLMACVLGMTDGCDAPAHKYDTFGQLVESLEAYDLGRFDNVAGQRLADIASSYSQEELLDILIGLDPEEILGDRNLTARAEALSSVRKLYAEAAARQARIIDEWRPPGWGELSGTVSAAVSVAPPYWKNAVAEELLKRVEVAIIIDPVGGMVSFRSTGVDVASMAIAMGGGGHNRASGFKANSWDLLRVMMQEIFE
jgi:oligoribonuclease NrnB/cAMP/cGMP phosphodiesterase (DHH superfamily)